MDPGFDCQRLQQLPNKAHHSPSFFKARADGVQGLTCSDQKGLPTTAWLCFQTHCMLSPAESGHGIMIGLSFIYRFINSGIQTFREPYAALSRPFATAAKHAHPYLQMSLGY